MARPLRVEFRGAWYHVMNRGAGRRRIYKSPHYMRIFLDLLGQISQLYCVEVHAYCLMENHYHLLIRTPEAGLGRAMRHLNGVYAQRFNRLMKTDGPLFRGRYKAILVDADTYLLQLIRYIHLNPVVEGLTRDPAAYPHSSCGAYVGLAATREWLHTSTCLSLFGQSDARERYLQFLAEGLDEEIRAFYNRERLDPVLGGSSFKDAVQKNAAVAKERNNPEMPDARRVERFSLNAISDATCASFAADEASLHWAGPQSRRCGGLARGAFVYLARLEGGHSLVSIAEWLGHKSYSGSAGALHRFRRSLANSSALRQQIAEARRLLHQKKT